MTTPEPLPPADARAHYHGALDRLVGQLVGQLVGRPGDAADLAGRRRALERFFERGGFPTGADEDFRFDDLAGLGEARFEPADPVAGSAGRDGSAQWTLPSWAAGFERRHVFPFFPSDPGATGSDERETGVGSGPSSLAEHPFELLNRAFHVGGATIRVPAGVSAGEILLLTLAPDRADPAIPPMRHARNRIRLEPGSRLTLVEVFAGENDGGWTDSSTECSVGEGAELRHVHVALESGSGAHTARTTFLQEKDSRTFGVVLALDGARVRHDARAVLAAPGAETQLDGLTLGTGGSRAGLHTLVVHEKPHATSRQLYKNVLADASRAVFDGTVVVAPGADGADASQSNRNLLLSDDARVHTQPRLQIRADDVRCAHGAAIGRLDEDALFYLRSRGLGRLDSLDILVRAFAGEVMERIPAPAARALAEERLAALRPRLSRAA